jgi:hypothetical protein
LITTHLAQLGYTPAENKEMDWECICKEQELRSKQEGGNREEPEERIGQAEEMGEA